MKIIDTETNEQIKIKSWNSYSRSLNKPYRFPWQNKKGKLRIKRKDGKDYLHHIRVRNAYIMLTTNYKNKSEKWYLVNAYNIAPTKKLIDGGFMS